MWACFFSSIRMHRLAKIRVRIFVRWWPTLVKDVHVCDRIFRLHSLSMLWKVAFGSIPVGAFFYNVNIDQVRRIARCTTPYRMAERSTPNKDIQFRSRPTTYGLLHAWSFASIFNLMNRSNDWQKSRSQRNWIMWKHTPTNTWGCVFFSSAGCHRQTKMLDMQSVQSFSIGTMSRQNSSSVRKSTNRCNVGVLNNITSGTSFLSAQKWLRIRNWSPVRMTNNKTCSLSCQVRITYCANGKPNSSQRVIGINTEKYCTHHNNNKNATHKKMFKILRNDAENVLNRTGLENCSEMMPKIDILLNRTLRYFLCTQSHSEWSQPEGSFAHKSFFRRPWNDRTASCVCQPARLRSHRSCNGNVNASEFDRNVAFTMAGWKPNPRWRKKTAQPIERQKTTCWPICTPHSECINWN